MIPQVRWYHVAGAQNAADIASRGVFPEQLRDFKPWRCGPDWLQKPSSSWPIFTTPPSIPEDADLKVRRTVALSMPKPSTMWGLVTEKSRLEDLLRVTARVPFVAARFKKEDVQYSQVVTP